MKKSLVVALALVFVLGIAGTALAANPFTDVPANHWAYASISKLAQAGIIDGYGDGRFIGNNTMTRYEMAQIVAKAMAKTDRADGAQRAQIEKLAAEFADELDSLGVRVAKLEKNSDNVKITGEARFANYSYDRDKDSDNSTLRTRLWLTGEVNERWAYKAMLEHNGHDFKTNSNNDDDTRLRRAWVEGSIGVVNVTAGAFNYMPMYGTILDNDMDGIVLNYNNNKFSMDLFAGRPDELGTSWFSDFGEQNFTLYGTQMAYAFSDKLNVRGAYYKVDGSETDIFDANLVELGLDYRFNKDLAVWGQYLRGDSPDGANFGKNGWAAGLQAWEADRNKPGTFQLTAAYYDVPAMAAICPTTELFLSPDGFKGWTVGANYIAAKNIDVNIEYFDFKSQGEFSGFGVEKQKEKLLWTYVRFYF